MDHMKRAEFITFFVFFGMRRIVKKRFRVIEHPDGKTKIIIDRYHMHPLTRERHKIGGQGRHQSLAFSGFHLGDAALVESNAAKKLNVKMSLAQSAFRR